MNQQEHPARTPPIREVTIILWFIERLCMLLDGCHGDQVVEGLAFFSTAGVCVSVCYVCYV